MIKWQQQFIHKSNLTWLQILVYQLVTEQVTDDTEVMTTELKVKMLETGDLTFGLDKGLLDGGNI